MTIATSFEQVTNNSPDGAQMGKGTAEKVAFYGSTPVVQPTSANQAAVTKTAAALTENSNDTSADVTIADCRTPISDSSGNSTKATDVNALFVIVDSNFADLAEMMNKLTTDSAATNVLANQLRSELVTLGLIEGA